MYLIAESVWPRFFLFGILLYNAEIFQDGDVAPAVVDLWNDKGFALTDMALNFSYNFLTTFKSFVFLGYLCRWSKHENEEGE